MYYINLFICVFLLILTSCSPNIQNQGLSEVKFNQINFEIGKTSKKDIIKKYGPPVFESVFKKNIIYYVSHKTSYKLLDRIKTKKLLIYEIILDDNNIVKNFKKYTEKDTFNVSVSDKVSDEKNSVFIWKELLNNIRRQNIQN